MGQALRKLESFYRKVESGNKISGKLHGNYMENSHIYNNLDNDDDYKVLVNKSNALKMYLARNLDRNKIENIEEVENLTIRLVEKVENKYLSVEEAAKHLDCTTKTIRNRIKAGMPYETDKNKYMISIEILEKWRHGKPEEVEIPEIEAVEPEVENLENENMEKVEPVNNSGEVEYIPSVVENFVTRDELNSYTIAVRDFTESINALRQDIGEVKSVQEEMKRQKEEENLLKRILEVEEKLTAWREESKQKKPLWKRLFGK